MGRLQLVLHFQMKPDLTESGPHESDADLQFPDGQHLGGLDQATQLPGDRVQLQQVGAQEPACSVLEEMISHRIKAEFSAEVSREKPASSLTQRSRDTGNRKNKIL